ncbi:MAG: hypothetical protein ACYC9L_09420 [Sulfuricaulis sp.]
MMTFQDDNYVPLENKNAICNGMEKLAIAGAVERRRWAKNDRIRFRAVRFAPKAWVGQVKSTPGRSLDNMRQGFQDHCRGQVLPINIAEMSATAVVVVRPTRGGNP